MDVQAIVIGSGFGGAVAALRLGEAGIQTIVLEVRPVGEITLLVGSGIGGGSLAYGGILIEPPRHLFHRAFPAAVDYDEMARSSRVLPPASTRR